MAVAPAQADGVPRIGPGADQFLNGEDEPSAGTQRVRGSRNNVLEQSEIDEEIVLLRSARRGFPGLAAASW